jgi:hypothetical protein
LANQRDDYAKRVGQSFTAHADAPAEWRLVAVSELNRHGDFESYSVEFETNGVGGAQGLVQLDHPEMGELELFVVAIGPGQYEAVFNQVVGEPA